MREAGGQGGGRLNMMPTIIGKQDADDDADDDADKDKHHTPIFSYRVFTVRTEDSINFFLPQK